MQPAYLIRDDVSAECIRGVLYVKDETFHVLERPWLNNTKNISCIASGTYNCTFLPTSASGKYKNIYWLTNVENRSGILIHNGNTVNHSKGCLIIGKRRGMLAGKRAVLNSKSALYELAQLMEQQPFNIYILGAQK